MTKGIKTILSMSGTGATRVAAMVLELVVTTLLVRVMSVHDYGLYSYAFTIAQVAVVIAAFGNPLVSTRFVAQLKASGYTGCVYNYIGRMKKYVMVVSIMVIGAVILACYIQSLLLNDVYLYAVVMIMLSLVPWSLTRYYTGCLMGGGNVTIAQLPEYLVRPAVFVLSVLTLQLTNVETESQIVIMLFIASAVFAYYHARALQHKHLGTDYTNQATHENNKVWLRTAFLLTMFGGLQAISAQADTLLLGLYKKPEDIAVYKVAYQIMAAAGFALTIINLVYAPRIASLYAQSRICELQRVVIMSARISLIGVLMPAMVIFTYGDALISSVFGPSYYDSYVISIIMIVGMIISAASGPVATVLNMTGHEKETVIASLSHLILVTLLCHMLIPDYGYYGAACAAAVTLGLKNVYLMVRLKMLLGVRSFVI